MVGLDLERLGWVIGRGGTPQASGNAEPSSPTHPCLSPADRSELDNVVDLLLRWSIASLPGGLPVCQGLTFRHCLAGCLTGAAAAGFTMPDN